jgi:hypothetical protein
MSDPIGTYELVALDCDDPIPLAEFYRSMVGGDVKTYPNVHDWVELHTSGGCIAFQHIDDHRPPTWPAGDRPQQAHLDIDVTDIDDAESRVLELGAVKADLQPRPDRWRVFFDPAGHPFCLVHVPPGS